MQCQSILSQYQWEEFMLNLLLKKITKSLFPILTWKKSLSFGAKLSLVLNSLGSIFIIVYLCIYFFSYLFYEYKTSNNHIIVYSNFVQIEHRSINDLIEQVDSRLKESPLYYSDYNVDIHIVDSENLFLILSFFMDIDAFNFLDRIFIYSNSSQKSDLHNYIYEEMVHEILHTFQYKRYGGIVQSKISIPFWVREGYPVYFSRKKLVLADEGVRLLKKIYVYGAKNLSLPDQYQLSGMLVRHAIEKMHKSVDDLHLGKVDYDEVLDSLRREYNITK